MFLCKDLTGSALAAVPNDQLDSDGEGSSKKIEKETTPIGAPSSEDRGMGVFAKLIFFGVIVGIIVVFLKSRKGSADKSLA